MKGLIQQLALKKFFNANIDKKKMYFTKNIKNQLV